MYNTKTKQAQQFLYSHMDVGKDLQQPKVLIHVLNKLIDQYSSSLPPDSNMDEFYARVYGSIESVIYVDEILDLIRELEKLWLDLKYFGNLDWLGRILTFIGNV